MSTSGSAEIILWPFLETYDGGPSGFWGGDARSTGDTSGGENRVSITLSVDAQRGRVFQLRFASLYTSSTTATTVEIASVGNYLSPSTSRWFAGETVAGKYGSSLVVPLYQPFLIIPSETNDSTMVIFADCDNQNGVYNSLLCQGVYWDLDHLSGNKIIPRFFTP